MPPPEKCPFVFVDCGRGKEQILVLSVSNRFLEGFFLSGNSPSETLSSVPGGKTAMKQMQQISSESKFTDMCNILYHNIHNMHRKRAIGRLPVLLVMLLFV